jgi:hypothetical protein
LAPNVEISNGALAPRGISVSMLDGVTSAKSPSASKQAICEAAHRRGRLGVDERAHDLGALVEADRRLADLDVAERPLDDRGVGSAANVHSSVADAAVRRRGCNPSPTSRSDDGPQKATNGQPSS